VEQVARLQELLTRATRLSKSVRELSGSMFPLFFSPKESEKRRALHREIDELQDALVDLDSEIIDYYRVTPAPGGGPNIDPAWFVIQMTVRANTRDAVLRYVREASTWISDLQMRAMTRATMLVSTIALVVTAISSTTRPNQRTRARNNVQLPPPYRHTHSRGSILLLASSA
jgi:hypothetical protein